MNTKEQIVEQHRYIMHSKISNNPPIIPPSHVLIKAACRVAGIDKSEYNKKPRATIKSKIAKQLCASYLVANRELMNPVPSFNT